MGILPRQYTTPSEPRFTTTPSRANSSDWRWRDSTMGTMKQGAARNMQKKDGVSVAAIWPASRHCSPKAKANSGRPRP